MLLERERTSPSEAPCGATTRCKACIVACPWGAAQWNPGSEKAVKCDLCKDDRMDQGLKPVCVTVCTTQCLSVKEIEEPAQRGPR